MNRKHETSKMLNQWMADKGSKPNDGILGRIPLRTPKPSPPPEPGYLSQALAELERQMQEQQKK